ncbi:MAG: FAD:protein FMN transferase, partial [Clostridiaceae bacterium]|nr:FAD:protein FMN transferase [Clostridiaceae bacterium]
MKRLLALLALFLVLTLALPACGPKSPAPGELQRFHADFIGLFDTLTQVIGYAESKTHFESQVQAL